MLFYQKLKNNLIKFQIIILFEKALQSFIKPYFYFFDIFKTIFFIIKISIPGIS